MRNATHRIQPILLSDPLRFSVYSISIPSKFPVIVSKANCRCSTHNSLRYSATSARAITNYYLLGKTQHIQRYIDKNKANADHTIRIVYQTQKYKNQKDFIHSALLNDLFRFLVYFTLSISSNLIPKQNTRYTQTKFKALVAKSV